MSDPTGPVRFVTVITKQATLTRLELARQIALRTQLYNIMLSKTPIIDNINTDCLSFT